MAGPGGPRSDIFRGCVVHVNGHTVPSRKELWEQIAIHGGSFERELRPGVTHVIVSELPDAKIQAWRGFWASFLVLFSTVAPMPDKSCFAILFNTFLTGFF